MIFFFVVPSFFRDLVSPDSKELESLIESLSPIWSFDFESEEVVAQVTEETGWVSTDTDTFNKEECFDSPEKARAETKRLILLAKQEFMKRINLLDELESTIDFSDKRYEK